MLEKILFYKLIVQFLEDRYLVRAKEEFIDFIENNRSIHERQSIKKYLMDEK